MTGFKIKNATSTPIEVMLSKYTNIDHGSDSWFTIAAGETSSWGRNGWEFLVFKDANENRRGWYLDCTSRTIDVTFRGLDREIEVDHPKGFNIRNATQTPVQVMVSAYTNGNGTVQQVYDVPPDFSDASKCHWTRNGWELLAFIDPASKTRRGWYLNTGDATVDVTFNGFDKDLTIYRPSELLIFPHLNLVFLYN